MAMMEQIHAKSYSHIFTTLLPSSETNYLLDEWVLERTTFKNINQIKLLLITTNFGVKKLPYMTNIWPELQVYF